MYTLAPKTIKTADGLAVSKYGISELTLMKTAAKSCFEIIYSRLSHKSKILILCGKGNNGGDGYELARILKKEFFDVSVINIFGCTPDTNTAKAVYTSYISDGGVILEQKDYAFAIQNATVIIDGIFGVGFHGEIDEKSPVYELLSLCGDRDDCLKIAIDVPSGINSLDGSVKGICFKADLTVTMAYYKTGMVSYPARAYCGEIILADVGYPKALSEEIQKDAFIPDDNYIKSVIPKTSADTHKGTFGRLLMFCASRYMTGAGVLAASAALRSGVGLVNIARDEKTLSILQAHLTEPVFSLADTSTEKGFDALMELSKKASCMLIGCGLGNDENDKRAVFSLIKNGDCPIILDADGINLVSENIMVLKEAKQVPILTPHPLEFSRLCGKSVGEIQQNRIESAKEFAKQYGCVIVLKGANTVIASPDGRLCINTSGNPGLSKGGSGDVLAGLCASLCCRGLSQFDSACAAVYLHGKAADVLRDEISEMGFLPSDLPLAIAKLLP